MMSPTTLQRLNGIAEGELLVHRKGATVLDNSHQISGRSHSLPIPTEIAHSPVSTCSLPNFESPQALKTCPCVVEPNGSTIQNKRCGDDCIRLCILKHPDSVRWYDQSEKVVIEKDEHGKVGFRVLEVEVSRLKVSKQGSK